MRINAASMAVCTLGRGHRFVLASRSDYFKALLDHAATEAADRDDSRSGAEPPAHEEAAEVRAPLAKMQPQHKTRLFQLALPASELCSR